MKIRKYGCISALVLLISACVTTVHGPTKIGKNIYLVEKEGQSFSKASSELLTQTLRIAIKYCENKNQKIKVTSSKKVPITSRSRNDIKGSIVFSCLNELSEDSILKNINFSNVDSIKALFSPSNMDPVEGIWTWPDNSYKIAIIQNKYNAYSDYEYIGVVSSSSSKSWEAGEIKLLLNSTASSDVYIGTYIKDDKVPEGTTFILSDDKQLETNIPSGNFQGNIKVSIVKSYPKLTTKNSNSNLPKESDKLSQGSCFFVEDSGSVVTNYHVVKDISDIYVIDHFGEKYKATLEQLDPSNDLAILKASTEDHHYINLASIGSARTGLEIFSVGYPASSILGKNVKYTEGVISSITGIQDMANMFQMTVPIQPGNSGGSILNMNGEVVGVATSSAGMEYFYSRTGSLPQNINWAIKSDYISLLLKNKPKKVNLKNRQEVIDAAINASCIVIGY